MASTLFRTLREGVRKNRHLLFLLLLPVTNILFTPLQSRLISPSTLGLYTSYILIISMVGIFSTFKAETLMYHTQDEEEYKKIGGSSLHILAYTTALFSVGITLFWYFYSKGDIKQVIGVMALTPFLLYAQGVDNVNRLFNMRISNSQYYYKMSFYRNLIKNISLISFVFLFLPNLFFILLGELAGRLFAVWTQLKAIRGTRIIKTFRWLIVNKKDTIYYSISLLINSVTASLPLFFIQYNSAQYGGEYAMYYRLFCVPCILISTVFADKLSASENSGQVSQKKLTSVLISLAVFIAIVLEFAPKSLYVAFLGEKWGGVSTVASTLAISLVLEMIFSGLSIIFIVKKKITYKYWFDGLFITCTIIPFIISKFDFFEQIELLNILRSTILGVFITVALIQMRK